MCCELREDLTKQYLRVLDLVDCAQHKLRNAATRTNQECAITELRRVEEYRLDVLRHIEEHSQSHGCATAELEGLCGLALVPEEAPSDQMVA